MLPRRSATSVVVRRPTAWLGLLIALALAGGIARAAGLPPAPAEEPLPAAQRSLRKADEYLGASCEMLRRGDRRAMDGYYVACQEAWNAVQLCPESPEVLCAASELYADALAGFLEAACRHGRISQGRVWVGPPGKLVGVPLVPKALPVTGESIASIEPQGQHDDKRISRRHLRDGFGLPVVVRLDPQAAAPAERAFAPDRQSLSATAVLRFDMPGGENVAEKFAGPVYRDHAAAVLDLANPVEIAAVKIGPARPHLAADLTAPLLDVLEGMPRSGIQGFLQPFGRGDTQPKLELLEPHVPGRIPVVFIHGLASDEGTWFDLLNELRAWPEFHSRFEPWVFHYPTGASFLQMAAHLRRQLTAAVTGLDPEGRDPALRRLVLVGHSMGGLHAKMMVVDSGTALWDSIATVPVDQVRMTSQVRELVTAEDDELVNAAQAFLERLPESVDQDPAQVRAWETLLASSLVNGLAAGGGLREVNAFDPLKHNRNHLGQFSPKYARPSVAAQTPAWQDKKERVLSVVQSAVQSQGAITQEWVDYAEIDGAEAQAIAQRTMDARDINGWKRVLTSNEAWKIVRDHGQDPKPIQTDDFLKLPELLASPVSQDWVSRKGKPDVLKSIIQEASGNLIIVEEERVGRRKLALLSMYRP
jgi:pimeloyl-ACP methyl ester carboxylesterase